MRKSLQDGSLAVVLVVVVLVSLVVAAAAFGAWAFFSRQDFKNNTDQKVAEAVEAAKTAQTSELERQFAEKAKSPYKVYQGSPTYGTLTFEYPKTWSAYVDETNNSNPINGYFHPDVVPGVNSQTAFALRVELVGITYSQAMAQYQSQVKTGGLQARAYVPPKLNGLANIQPGTLFDGAITPNQQGAMLLIKLRDKTLKISTQSVNFKNDFNTAVLPSLTFQP